ncbi:ABC transporter ATP-binding protein [Thermogutta sp.]|uniref:ABC transporter ATP-binding protein n=1 Tax=Thermogutta sp. TaxID=1962930 RepID=UPI003220530F
MTVLAVHGLKKVYPSPGQPVCVLNNVEFELHSGDRVAILGPSGSGKSTLLNIIGGLDQPTEGRVSVDGQVVSEMDETALSRYRNRTVGFVFQDHHLLPQCTVLENVLVPCLASGAPEREEIEWALALLERVGLKDRIWHRPGELSGGERQRVALARALIRRPALVLADEPTGNLDRTTGEHVAQLLVELHQEQNNILIVVTHSEHLAAMIGKRCRLENGQLTWENT